MDPGHGEGVPLRGKQLPARETRIPVYGSLKVSGRGVCVEVGELLYGVIDRENWRAIIVFAPNSSLSSSEESVDGVSRLGLNSVDEVHNSLWAVYDDEEVEVVSHEDKRTDPNRVEFLSPRKDTLQDELHVEGTDKG